MKIIVCLNFIICSPDESGCLVENRAGGDSGRTHLDNENKVLIEQALELKNQENDTVTVMAGGCDTDRVLLREALAMGCDTAWLIVRQSPYINHKPLLSVDMGKMARLAGFDIIITGYRVKSGFSSFLGAELAELLDLDQISCASKLALSKNNRLVSADIKYGNESLRVENPLPCVVTLANSTAKNEIISVTEIFQSFEKEMVIWRDEELDRLKFTEEKIAEKSFSDAVLIDSLKKSEKRKECVLYDEISVEEAVDIIIKNLRKQNIIKGTCL